MGRRCVDLSSFSRGGACEELPALASFGYLGLHFTESFTVDPTSFTTSIDHAGLHFPIGIGVHDNTARRGIQYHIHR